MKRFLFIIILNAAFLIINSFCFAQNKKTDSLFNLLKKDKEDTNKVNHSNRLCSEYLNIGLYDSALHFGKVALELAKQLNYNKGIARSHDNIGTLYFKQGNYSKALDAFSIVLKIDEELKDKSEIAKLLGHIGIIHWKQGDYPKALEFHFSALKLDEELGNKNGIAKHLGNIGVVYDELADYPKALEYYLKALKLDEELGNKNGISRHLGNIGIVYNDLKDYSKALDYFFRALDMAKELEDKQGNARHLYSIGLVYYDQFNYPKAMDFLFKALKMAEELGDRNGIAIVIGSVGSIYVKTGQFKKAEQYLKRAIILDDSIGSMKELMTAEKNISKLYDTIGRYKEALIHYKKSMALKDTVFSQENKKQIVRKEMNFEFEKKEAVTKATHDKEMAVAGAEKKKQKFILILVSCFLLLVFLFAGFVFRSLRITRKQKNIIELQKNEVYQQKEIVERQKEKIIDSITYAQRIQQSILMEESEIQNYLPESFIYFQPKDIVSGDFYWCTKIDEKIIIAAIDCTGHGVPGAFMSMVGNTLLNQIVNEKQITTPSEILRLLNIGVYEALHQKKNGALSRDGMDVALCCIDHKNNEMQYAGAQNSLFVLSDNKMTVIKADTQTVGGGGLIPNKGNAMKIKYTNHLVPIKKDMSIYLFSDGYMDQFGGPDRKKFGSQKFKELVLSNQQLSMQKQKELFATAHAQWKGNTPQIDDILVMGVRL